MGSLYAERGAITDEAIAVMKELWTKDDPSFVGKYSRFSSMPCSPKPLQRPHIPILIGGNSRAAIRRAVRLGNGWHPRCLAHGLRVDQPMTLMSLGLYNEPKGPFLPSILY